MSKEKNTKDLKKSKFDKIFNLIIVIVVCAAVVFGLVMAVINAVGGSKDGKSSDTADTSTTIEKIDFSKGLTEEGFIEGIDDETQYVELAFSPKEGIHISADEVVPTDAEIESEIEELLSGRSEEGLEFNDDFVKTYLESDLTAEEYRQKIKDDLQLERVTEYINSYVADAYTTLDVPDVYVDVYADYLKYIDQVNLQYMNALYSQLAGTIAYSDVYDMKGCTEEDYDSVIAQEADIAVVEMIAYQLMFKELDLVITVGDFEEYLVDNDILLTYEDYGMPYINSLIIRKMVNEKLIENAVIDYPEEDYFEEEE